MAAPVDLARLRPDTPQWVDLRGFLLSRRCDVHANADPGSGFVVRPWDLTVAVAAGEPEAEVIRAAVTDAAPEGEWHLLAGPESEAAVAAALPGWPTRGVTLHAWPESCSFPEAQLPQGYELEIAPAGWGLAGWTVDHFPDELAAEFRTELVRQRPCVAAFRAGDVVATCYAAVETEGLWDVAVDTLAEHRRQGLAAACFNALAVHMDGQGKRPVWGSLDGNAASMKLAARLGFEAAATLMSFVRSAP